MAETETKAGRARLRNLAAAQQRRLRLGAVLTMLAALVWPVQAALIASALAGLLGGAPGLSPMTAAAGVLVLGLVRALVQHRAEGLLFRAAQAVVTAQAGAILDRQIRAAGPSALGGPGAIAALAGDKLHALTPYLTRYAPAQARVAVLPLVILTLTAWHSWAAAVILIVAGPMIPLFMALIGMAAQEASERHMAEIGSLNDLLVDRIGALVDIRLLDAHSAVTEDFRASADTLFARTMAVLRIAFLSSTVLELFSALGVAMVAVWVGFSLLGTIEWGTWGTVLTPAAGIYLLLLAPDFFQPLRDLATAWHDRAAALAVAGELATLEVEEPAQMLGRGVPAAALPGPASVAFSGLAIRQGGRLIRYPEAAIAPGETVALWGPSGAGKTTLLRLIAGLVQPDAGAVIVAGRPLDEDSADAWRARLGWMPQAPLFLNRSLRHNVTFGAPVDPALVRAAALEVVIDGLPQGQQTLLGETGGGLSGGEARRVMLARALHGRPDVILADEPTADLDAATAERVTEALLARAAEGVTLIVATHDPRLAGRLGRVLAIGEEA